MSNSDQIRKFFQNFASGAVMNSASHSLLHDKNSLPVDQLSPWQASNERANANDFGVGLPPLAHC